MITRDLVGGSTFPAAPLGEVVQFLDHLRRPVTAKDRVAGPYPYYGANGQQDSVADYIFNEELVLLAEDGGHFDDPDRGVAYRVTGPCWVNNHAHVLRPLPAVDGKYLGHALRNYHLAPFVTGTTRGKLTKASAARIPIPIPPIEEQRRIAATLDRADSLRRDRDRAIGMAGRLAGSVFDRMFGSRLWPEATLDDLCTIAGEYGAGVASVDMASGLPRYIRITDISADGRLNNDVRGPAGTEQDWARYRLEPGDVLFARSGATVGKTYHHDDPTLEAVFAGYLIRFRPDPTRLDPTYLFGYTMTSKYAAWVKARQNVVAQPNINARQYGRELPIPLPPLAAQQAFGRRWARVQEHLQVERWHSFKLEELFASLQDRAFSGRL